MSLSFHRISSSVASRAGLGMVWGLVLALTLLPSGVARAQDATVDRIEADLALRASQKKIVALEAENHQLKEKLATLGSVVAAANAEALASRAEVVKARAELDALGISALEPTAEGLRRNLKAAVANALKERERTERLSSHLAELAEAARGYRLSAITKDPQADRLLEQSLEQVRQHFTLELIPELDEPNLNGAKVVAARRDLELVVLNVGAEAGARIGMPLRLMRGDRQVGEAIVVDIRERAAAAMIQQLIREDDPPQVGDLALLNVNTLR